MLWHALAVNTLSEVRIRNSLHEDGICSFCPVELVSKRAQGKLDAYRALPLIPGYVFVESAHARNHWGLIKEVRGVRRFLQQGESWLTVAQGDIDELDALQSRLQFIKTRQAKHVRRLDVGTKINVVAGPFAGYASEISAIKKRVAEISVRIFGTTTRHVWVPLEHLEAV